MRSNKTISLLLVGNKSDLNEKRQVSYDEASELAKDKNIEYIETSAKTGENVDVAFKKLIEMTIEKVSSGIIIPNNHVTLNVTYRME